MKTMFDLNAWHKSVIRHTIITLSFANRLTPITEGVKP